MLGLRPNDDQVPGLEPVRHRVEVEESGRHARHPAAVLTPGLDLLEHPREHLAEMHEPATAITLRDGVERLLAAVEDYLGVVSSLVGFRQHAIRDGDDGALVGLLAHDAGVMGDVGGLRESVDERGEVGRTADFVELPRPVERILERHELDRRAGRVQPQCLLEDPAVRLAPEVLRLEQGRDVRKRVFVQQHRAQDGAFRVEGMRHRAFTDRAHTIDSCSAR
jgi:hypothetical protein